MKDEFISRVGLWWQRHYNFLKKNSPTVINVMRLNGTLEQYLNDLDRNAQEMFELLTKQYAELEGITEELKAENQVEWVSQMNSIKARVINIVNAELIYVRNSGASAPLFAYSKCLVENNGYYFRKRLIFRRK